MSPAELKKLRTEYGFTQQGFSRALGVSSQTVSFWERGSTKPSIYHEVILARLADMLQDEESLCRAKNVLNKTQFMPPELQDDRRVIECGIGCLLFCLFTIHADDYSIPNIEKISCSERGGKIDICQHLKTKESGSRLTSVSISKSYSKKEARCIKNVLRKAADKLEKIL